jgi:hypothetical protein
LKPEIEFPQPASSTAARNWRVRSLVGLPDSWSGGAGFDDLAGVEEADPVGELLGEAHVVSDQEHGEVVLGLGAP